MSQDILNKTSHRSFVEKCAKIYYEMQKNVRKGACGIQKNVQEYSYIMKKIVMLVLHEVLLPLGAWLSRGRTTKSNEEGGVPHEAQCHGRLAAVERQKG